MPVYEYQCPKCGHLMEEFFHAESYPQSVKCVKCDTESPKILSWVHVAGSHTNKMTERVPGESKSISVDGFKVVPSPPSQRKMFRKNGRRLPKHKVPLKRRDTNN